MEMKKTFTVLVVEDEKLLLEAIGRKMEIEGIDTVLCETGAEAFEYLEKGPVKPNLVWLDYHLSDMDGISFMNKLHASPGCSDMPVVVVSNTASDEKVHAMMLLGAKRYVVKAESKLLDVIRTIKELGEDL